MENEIKDNAEVTKDANNNPAEVSADASAGNAGQAGSSAPAKNSENKEVELKGQKPQQDSATNKAFQNMRKEHERALKEAQRQERLKTIKEMHPTNPYNNKPIEDEYDVQEFLLMRRIEQEGGDPLNDYSAYLKKENKSRQAEQKSAEEQKRANDEKVTNDLADFAQKYADVDVKELLADETFRAFADGKLETRSLSEVYEQFLPIKNMIDEKRKRIEQEATDLANKKASPGSLSSPQPNAEEFFTKEQVLKMSADDIKKNFDKIRKSQERW
ncbi:MAG: hypothetical protein IJA82_02720 [Clostridia bacterium]|nr:hypothetical protein [Clostridia bacterium]